VSYPRLVLDLDGPERGEQLLDEVVLLVVEGGPAEAGEAEGAPVELVAVDVLPGRLAGRRYFTLVSRSGAVTRFLEAAPLGQSRPRLTGLSGSPSIWMTCSSLT